MNRISQIIADSKNALFKILLNWEKIAGSSNRDIMIPFQLKSKVLSVAVPNSMVEKTASRFKEHIIDNINRHIGKDSVTGIKFSIDTSKFTGVKKKEPEKEEVREPVSKKEVSKKAAEIEKTGVAGSLAQTLAEIELLLKRDRKK
jgi:hypothetical protein